MITKMMPRARAILRMCRRPLVSLIVLVVVCVPAGALTPNSSHGLFAGEGYMPAARIKKVGELAFTD